MTGIYAFGIGIGTSNTRGELLEVWYPQPLLQAEGIDSKQLAQWQTASQDNDHIVVTEDIKTSLTSLLLQGGLNDQATLLDSLTGSAANPVILCVLNQDEAPAGIASGFLKLHLLSHRLVKPHDTNLTGLFGVLKNLAWTSEGAVDLDELQDRQRTARLKGQPLQVQSVDKFPKMTDYVVPSGVRIGDASRIRLGAYLGEGTTVMHEGFVNFNAGTEGPGMIEGRISAGVFIGAGSDLGGGCSTMGTLSGGGNIIISVGKECLIGANAGVGIPLGDRCTVEAGLYITAGSKVALYGSEGTSAGTVKAADLAGKSDLLFRRNSQSGAIECLSNTSVIALNEELHKHN